MKSAGDIGLVYKGHYLIIEAHFPSPKAFAKITVQK
jgi:hypothetical protein